MKTIHPHIDGFEFPELIISVEITDYKPERPAPFCRNPDDPRFYDDGDPEEVDYTLKGFLRFEPDNVDEYGGATGLLLELTPDQLVEIRDHFELDLQIADEARKIYEESLAL